MEVYPDVNNVTSGNYRFAPGFWFVKLWRC